MPWIKVNALSFRDMEGSSARLPYVAFPFLDDINAGLPRVALLLYRIQKMVCANSSYESGNRSVGATVTYYLDFCTQIDEC